MQSKRDFDKKLYSARWQRFAVLLVEYCGMSENLFTYDDQSVGPDLVLKVLNSLVDAIKSITIDVSILIYQHVFLGFINRT